MFWFFLTFMNLFFRILMHQSSSDFSGQFQMKAKSCKTSDIIISTKFVAFKFQLWGFGAEGGAAARQPPFLGVRPYKNNAWL
jgi:hypothetical protein